MKVITLAQLWSNNCITANGRFGDTEGGGLQPVLAITNSGLNDGKYVRFKLAKSISAVSAGRCDA